MWALAVAAPMPTATPSCSGEAAPNSIPPQRPTDPGALACIAETPRNGEAAAPKEGICPAGLKGEGRAGKGDGEAVWWAPPGPAPGSGVAQQAWCCMALPWWAGTPWCAARQTCSQRDWGQQVGCS